jgi:hypothetical protein
VIVELDYVVIVASFVAFEDSFGASSDLADLADLDDLAVADSEVDSLKEGYRHAFVVAYIPC